MKVCIVGQGYVGLPLSVGAANAGHHVTGIDIDEVLVDALNHGQTKIEDVNKEDLKNLIKSGNYTAKHDFTSVSTSEIVIVCVPTPLDSNKNPDNSFLFSALKDITKHLQQGKLIIIESTVSPGTTSGPVFEILGRSGVQFDLAFSPERVDPGNSKWNISNTPKLIAGINENSANRAYDFYKSFIEDVRKFSSMEVVEAAKLLENSFRLINISFINEFAEFCYKLNIDVREVISAASSKPYGFMPFFPTSGIGGHCIPVDPVYLSSKAKEIGANVKFIELAIQVNEARPKFFADVAKKKIGSLKGKKILLIGVAYKPGISDTRETPALGLLNYLRSQGAQVSWHDEKIETWNNEISVDLENEFDLAILVNPTKQIDLSSLANTPVIDTRGGYS